MQARVNVTIAEFSKLYDQNPQRVLDDTNRLIASFPSLIAQSDIYFTNEGTEQRLLCLTGTVPINFKGTKYNIPVMIWVPLLYPFCSPMCFVTPTKDMVIKQNHKHVDPNGQCNVPYSASWNTSSNMFELVAELCGVFSKEPPLFAKTAQTATTHASFRNAKPLPAPPTTILPVTQPPTIINPRHTPPPSSLSSSQIPRPQTPPNALAYQLTPPAVRIAPTLSASNPLHNNSPLYQKAELTRQITQLLQRRLEEFCQTTTKDMEMFMNNQNTLESRNSELEKSIQTLRAEESKLEQAAEAAIMKSEEMDKWITVMEQKTDIDDLVQPSDAISHQLFAVVAEDHSIDDVIYYLGKGLANGKITFDTYFKEVRMLSRQQFFQRALAMKLIDMQIR